MAVNTSTVTRPANGLNTALNVIVSPREAFETLREFPMWGWALIISLVLAGIGSVLAFPAQMHAMHATTQHMYATDPRLSALSDAQKAQQMAMTDNFAKFGFIFLPVVLLLVALVQAGVFMIVNALGHGKTTFAHLWAAAININIVGFGLQQLFLGILAMVRGPGAYNTPLDGLLAIPSLGWLAPQAAPKVTAFLAAINPFSIWVFILSAVMLMLIARVGKAPAYVGSAVMLIVGALFATIAVK